MFNYKPDTAQNYDMPFLARITDVTVSGDGLYLYGWVEQTFSTTTGEPVDADPARSGTATQQPALEPNNRRIEPGTYVYIRSKGFVNNDFVYEVVDFAPGRIAQVTSDSASDGWYPAELQEWDEASQSWYTPERWDVTTQGWVAGTCLVRDVNDAVLTLGVRYAVTYTGLFDAQPSYQSGGAEGGVLPPSCGLVQTDDGLAIDFDAVAGPCLEVVEGSGCPALGFDLAEYDFLEFDIGGPVTFTDGGRYFTTSQPVTTFRVGYNACGVPISFEPVEMVERESVIATDYCCDSSGDACTGWYCCEDTSAVVFLEDCAAVAAYDCAALLGPYTTEAEALSACASGSGSGSGSGPTCECDLFCWAYSEFAFTLSGITNAGCFNCPAWDGTHTLVYTPPNGFCFGGGCLWGETTNTDFCNDGIGQRWYMADMNFNGFDGWHLFTAQFCTTNPAGGGFGEDYQLVGGFDPLGSNTFARVTSPYCTGMPATITITPSGVVMHNCPCSSGGGSCADVPTPLTMTVRDNCSPGIPDPISLTQSGSVWTGGATVECAPQGWRLDIECADDAWTFIVGDGGGVYGPTGFTPISVNPFYAELTYTPLVGGCCYGGNITLVVTE